jgi:hypothetical protein
MGMKEWMKEANWLKAAGVFTVVYLIGAMLVIGPSRTWAFVTTEGKLNEIGDFLAGVFSPLAFIWLVAAVLTQRQELDETRDQFVENQKVVDAQMSTIERQNERLTEQHKLAEESAQRTYRLSLFEQRFEIYNDLIALHNELEDRDLVVEDQKTIETIAERSAFVFSEKIFSYLTKQSERCTDLFVFRTDNEMSWYTDPVEGGSVPMNKEHVAVRKRAMEMKFGIQMALSPEILRELMWSSMRVSDD